MRKKYGICFLILVMIVLMASCSRDSGSAAGGPVTLRYWDMMWGDADLYPTLVENLLERYEQANGGTVKVNVEFIPWTNFYQVFLTAITSGVAPDYSTGGFPQAVQYGVMGETLHLNEIVAQWRAENNPIIDDMIKGSITLHTHEGNYVGIAWSADSRQIIYRRDAFEQAGITRLPTTYAEFLDACRLIRDRTNFIPFVFSPSDFGGTHVMINFLVGNGVGIVDNDLNPLLETPQAMEVLQFFKTLYDERLVPEGVVSYIGSDQQRLVTTGGVAIAFSGSPAYLSAVPDVAAQFSVLPPLAGPSGTNQNFTWMAAIMGYRQTRHPNEVRQTIKWWLENNVDLWTTNYATNPLPIRLSYFSHPNFTTDRFVREIGQISLPSAVPPIWPAEFLYPEFAQIEGENLLGIALQDIMQGRSDLGAIAREVNSKIAEAFIW